MRIWAAIACCGWLAVIGVVGAPATAVASRPRRWKLVALGDSVPYGTDCDCTPYPDLTARDLARMTRDRAQATNLAVPGAETADLLEQLSSDAVARRDVRRSDVVMLEIGANDVQRTNDCANDVACYTPDLKAMRGNLRSIVAQIHRITRARPVPVVLLDYWNVWLGGQYAQAQGAAYASAAKALTGEVDRGIRRLAAASHSDYVDLRRAFRGPSHRWDETHLLASDGDHPNARGHRRIAGAIRRTAFPIEHAPD